MTREHQIAALAVELGVRLLNPAPMLRLRYDIDPRDDELRDTAVALEFKRRVARNEMRRRQA